MVDILDPQEGETIYDPACGTGGMLLEAVQHVARRRGATCKTLYGKLFGQEKNLTTSAIARINLFLHGVEDFKIVRGDTLRQPAFFDGDRLATLRLRDRQSALLAGAAGARSTGRQRPVGPQHRGGAARHQRRLRLGPAHDRLDGTPSRDAWPSWCPHGALFRAGAEGSIRQKILETDTLEAVIGLAPNLFYGAGLAACVLVFRARKAARTSRARC